MFTSRSPGGRGVQLWLTPLNWAQKIGKFFHFSPWGAPAPTAAAMADAQTNQRQTYRQNANSFAEVMIVIIITIVVVVVWVVVVVVVVVVGVPKIELPNMWTWTWIMNPCVWKIRSISIWGTLFSLHSIPLRGIFYHAIYKMPAKLCHWNTKIL